jgi:endonuclease/exonuclease/phosphatase family metal-dependent hydrolase
VCSYSTRHTACMGRLRVLTWNLWWRRGPWRQRYEAISNTIHAAAPEICGLQEVWADTRENIAESMASRLGMHWTWVPTPAPRRWNERIGDPTVVVGNAVLSRWPIVDTGHVHLPAGDIDEGRTAMLALIEAHGCRIPFFTTHLNSAAHQSAIRCAQVRALAQFVSNHPGQGFPPIVTGDFNAEPDSDEIRLIGGRKTAPAIPGLLLLDAWQYAEPYSDGLTWNRANPFTAQHWMPSARVDYVFVGPPMPTGVGMVRSAQLIGDGMINGVWPSDHAGVLVDLASVD